MKLKVIATLIATVAVGASVSNNLAYAGTTSASLTVNSNLTMGTCSAKILDTSDTVTDTVAFNNVYISELAAKSKVQPFKIRFSDCAGLPGKVLNSYWHPKVSVALVACLTLPALQINLTPPPKVVQAEQLSKYGRLRPRGSGSKQFSCIQRNVANVDLSNASTTQPYDFDLSARMILAEGRTVNDALPGSFLSPTTFTITYQ